MAPSNMSDNEESPLYGADDFRIYCMKVLPCSKRYCHDWTTCPFAHPGEKARRRDPRVFNYTGIACPDMKKEGACPRREACPYAHNVFEYWLHPTRYRTQLCNDDNRCKRRICFFAHTLDELRVPSCKPFVPPEALAAATPPDAMTDAAGNPCDWNKAFGVPKGPGTGAFAGGHTNRALADLQSKLASLQLAVQSTQPGTKLHQDQEMMINVLSAALRNAYVINSFSAGAPAPAPADDLNSRLIHHQQHAGFMPHGDSLPAVLGGSQHFHHQTEPRSGSNPDLLPWQARQLRENLAMEYARMSLDSVQATTRSDLASHSRRLSDAEIAYHMGMSDSQTRASMSDLSSRMSLSDVARLSLSDFSGMSNSESSSQPGIWQHPGVHASNMAGPISGSFLHQHNQQMTNGQDSHSLAGSGHYYQGDAMQQQAASQTTPLLQHQWAPYATAPSFPSSSTPYPSCLDAKTSRSGTKSSAFAQKHGDASARNGQASPVGPADHSDATIRPSLMTHWQQQQAGRGSSDHMPKNEQPSQAEQLVGNVFGNLDDQPSGHRAGSIPPGFSHHSVPALSGSLNGHQEDLLLNGLPTDARSSSDSSRFSMDSLRRSIESSRFAPSARASSSDSGNGRYSFSDSPKVSELLNQGQDSFFAYQPAIAPLAPMASVPETEPMSSSLPL